MQFEVETYIRKIIKEDGGGLFILIFPINNAPVYCFDEFTYHILFRLD